MITVVVPHPQGKPLGHGRGRPNFPLTSLWVPVKYRWRSKVGFHSLFTPSQPAVTITKTMILNLVFVRLLGWSCIYSVHNKWAWNYRLVFTADQLFLWVSVINRSFVPCTLSFIYCLSKYLFYFTTSGIFLSSTVWLLHVFAAISSTLLSCALILLPVCISRGLPHLPFLKLHSPMSVNFCHFLR